MPKHIIILAVPGVQLLDVSGPLDVFAEANRQRGRDVYTLSVMAIGDDPVVRTSSGARLFADLTLATPLPAAVDTFLVAGAPVLETFLRDEKLKDGIRTWKPPCEAFWFRVQRCVITCRRRVA